MSRCKVYVLGPGAVVGLLRGRVPAGDVVPADAIPVGPPAVSGGVIRLLLKSPSFPETPEGSPYPVVDVRLVT